VVVVELCDEKLTEHNYVRWVTMLLARLLRWEIHAIHVALGT
jgi:hypothetical protein